MKKASEFVDELLNKKGMFGDLLQQFLEAEMGGEAKKLGFHFGPISDILQRSGTGNS